MSSEVTHYFIERITRVSKSLADAHRETVEFWAPEEPPLTIALAEIGRRVVEDFDAFEPDARTQVFSLIEVALQGGDQHLSTAVATGLIEAMIARADALGTWERIRSHLEEFSKRYADAWCGARD